MRFGGVAEAEDLAEARTEIASVRHISEAQSARGASLTQHQAAALLQSLGTAADHHVSFQIQVFKWDQAFTMLSLVNSEAQPR